MAGGTFDDVLNGIRAEAKNTKELGSKFERITRDFMKTDSLYMGRFEKVWLWKQWPKNDGPDTGIDIVAQQYDGELCAIQCKCYADDGTLNMKAVSTFLAKAKSLDIKHTILVYTGEELTRHAQTLLRDSHTSIITPEHFRQSSIDWSRFPSISQIKNPKKMRPHQIEAFNDVVFGFKNHERGKLIMACGTGKTLTSLHVAEKLAGKSGFVLYLVPSISLILQSMREWSENSNIRHNYMAVCSDKSTGEEGSITELESPVSTDWKALKPYIQRRPKDAMTVIFSTYHSIEVVEHASKGYIFDLILCDEAHRTTGTEGKSYYTRVHDEKNIHAKRRLYMTATPKVYSDAIKSLGKRKGKVIYSMDDPKRYGPDFHKLSFTDAVHKYDILADFKVKIAIVDADRVDRHFQQSVADKDKALPLDERTLLAAIWHGLRYPDDDESKQNLLQRVIAFCNRIDRSEMFAGVMKDPDDNDRSFEGIVSEMNQKKDTGMSVKVRHIDGKDNALHRRNEMRWLEDSHLDQNQCRIVSNARCLSEGVDVPSLDGVVFLNPRKSVVDVVQSVGRVMRKTEGKKFGYVILPVAIPAGLDHAAAMNDNKTFKVVWEVLNALRSHDEEFAREINNLILDKRPENTGPVTPRISISVLDQEDSDAESISILFDQIKSKIIQKVGDYDYYDKYGQKLGSATHTIEARIKNKMDVDVQTYTEIRAFHTDLKSMINDSITEQDAIRAISQHMVLSRVFDGLFAGEFTSHNPISIAFNKIVKKMGLTEELEELEEFYEDVNKETTMIKTRDARQSFIKKIYGNFFESADKKGTEQHGIVYTPIEIVDFIIHSVQHILKQEFKIGFDSRDVKVLEPFAGTGTFLVRLLESGYLNDNIYEKYKHDLFANELILLAYYIATINIETTYQSLRRGNKYVPFDGISYTDTLMANAQYKEDKEHRAKLLPFTEKFKAAHERISKQKWSHLHVLLGNPPYSVGQNNFNDQNPNISYPELDKRIENTYVQRSKTGAKNALYDSYVRSIRWATDRIGKSGVIAFITNAGFLRSDTGAGLRACLEEEFTDVWCFDLKGNARTQGETRRKEGDGVFGMGSRAPVAITILVKNPKKNGCSIHYKNIGDYHSRERKLEIIKTFKSIQGIKDWDTKTSDSYHDWLDKRNKEFYRHDLIGSKDVKSGKMGNVIFTMFSQGVATSRDSWAYNSSKKILAENMKVHIDYCNKQNPDKPKINPKKAKWTRELTYRLKRSKPKFNIEYIRNSLYRPFYKQLLYFDAVYTNYQFQIPKFFPEKYSKNLVICIPYKFTGNFSVLVTDITPDIQLNFNGQCFPLYTYENNADKKTNITDYALQEYRSHYKDQTITKKSIFYYIYGILHHSGYKKKFANNLSKELPHIPMAPDFWAFSKTGEKLVDLHLNFESCTRYKLGKPKYTPKKFTKLAFGSIKDGKKRKADKSKIKIDGVDVFESIPIVNYKVNGRTPLEWIVDRYRFTRDNDSGITNDPCTGTDIIAVIERAIYIGVESDKLIEGLPKEFEPKNWKPKKHGLEKFSQQVTLDGTGQKRLF